MNLLKVPCVGREDSEYINPAKIIKFHSTEDGTMIVLDDGQYLETPVDKDTLAASLRNL